MPSKDCTVYLTHGLAGRDQDVDLLVQLFEESQVSAIETANPALDLISFVQDCSEFWVINAGNPPAEPVEAWRYDFPPKNNSLGLHSSPSSVPNELPPILPRASSTPSGDVTPNTSTRDNLPKYAGAQCGPSHIPTFSHNDSNPRPIWPNATTGYSNHEMYQLSQEKTIAGFAYLVPSSAFPDALHFQEYNIGIILRQHWRGQGVAEKALHLALDLAFARTDVHRVQAQLIDCYKNDKALTLFTRIGFSHEGTRRQAFRCPLTEEWKDVTTLALLVTDWFMHVRDRRNNFRPAPKSLWDALFMRHQQECEELLRWEDKRLYRTSSLETIREGAATPVPSFHCETDTSDAEAASPSGCERSGRPKRKLFEIGNGKASGSDAYDASSSEYESEYASAAEGSPPKRIRSRRDEPNHITGGTRAFEIDWTNTNLDDLPGEMQPLTDELHHLDGGRPVSSSTHVIVHRDEITTAIPEAGTRQIPGGSSDQSSDSRSPSPDSRETSVLSVPSSEPEPETESEDDYAASSSPESSNWELVESDDDLGL